MSNRDSATGWRNIFYDGYSDLNSDDYTLIRWNTISNNSVDANVRIFFANGDVEKLIAKCPKKCPLKRGDNCLSDRCIREYPKKTQS